MKEIFIYVFVCWGFPCGSAGKESACNAGDLGSIPGLERSPGEAKGYPLQYSGLENSMDLYSLKELDMTEQLSLSKKKYYYSFVYYCWLAVVSPEVYLNERRR